MQHNWCEISINWIDGIAARGEVGGGETQSCQSEMKCVQIRPSVSKVEVRQYEFL